DAVTEAVLLASRAMVGIAARTLPDGSDVTVVQLRALVVLESGGPMSAGALAERMGVNPSTVTRLCDRLVRKGLISRRSAPGNRKEVRLELRPAGARLVGDAIAARRAAIAAIVRRIPSAQRAPLVDGLRAFAAASGELPEPARSQ